MISKNTKKNIEESINIQCHNTMSGFGT